MKSYSRCFEITQRLNVFLCCLVVVLILMTSCLKDLSETGKEGIFQFLLTDSVVINHVGQLTYADFNQNDKSLLFFSEKSEIIRTDLKGEILNQFLPLNLDEGKMGKTMYSLGFFDDSTVVATSERGYFFFSLDGKLLRSLDDISKYALPILPDIFRYSNGGKEVLISLLKGFYNPYEETITPGSVEYFERFQLLTVKDLSDETHSLAVGFEKEGLFRTKPRAYLDIFPSIAYRKDMGDIFVVFNPDPFMYIYDVGNDFSLENKIDISPEHFNNPEKPPKEIMQGDLTRTLLMNGRFASIDVWGNRQLVVYSSGVSEEDYDGTIGGDFQRMSEFDARFNKRYAILFENGKKLGRDVLLPKKMATAATFLSDNELLLIPNANLIEKRDRAVFYRYLIEIRNK